MRSAPAIVFAILSGCGINPQRVDTIPSGRNYLSFSCPELVLEKARIEGDFAKLRWSNRPGTTQAFGLLKGQAYGVDSAAQEKRCGLVPVRIPGYPLKESRGDAH